MIKKIFLALFLLAVLAGIGVGILSRKAPDLLRQALGRALDRDVEIDTILYHFPGRFELRDVKILERAPFEGEASFQVGTIRLEVSPLSFSSRSLILDRIEASNAQVVLRKYRGRVQHALSDAIRQARGDAGDEPAPGPSGEPSERAGALPLVIREFALDDSRLSYLDYDVDASGFAITFDKIRVRVEDLSVPYTARPTRYEIEASLLQGRDRRPAEFRLTGWTRFATLDTDANLSAESVFLPYFHPYYAQVTPASIEYGELSTRSNVRIERKDLVANVDFEIVGLLFRSYEAGDQLFGLRAQEILDFLKDRAGRLRFQFVLKWNLADRSVDSRQVIRQAIERSLKSTILGNVGNLLQNAIQKIGEQGIDSTKDDLEDTIKKFKKLFS